MAGHLRLLTSAFFVAAVISFPAKVANSQSTELKARPTGSISGRVTVGGKPMAGIPIGAFSTDSLGRRSPAAAQTSSDQDGKYQLLGLAGGQYQVTALAPQFTDTESSNDSTGFFVGSSKSILLANGEQIDNIDLKLARGGVITGRVTDAEGKPVINESVGLQVAREGPGEPARIPYFTYVTQMNRTDDRGIYRIYGLPAGRYRVSVGSDSGQALSDSGRGYFRRTYHPDVTDLNRAEIIELTPGTEATGIDIRVGRREETFSVSGNVFDENGVPVNNARVGLMVAVKDSDRFSSMFTGFPTMNGKFKMDGLSPGRYAVFVSSQFDGAGLYSDPVNFEIVDQNVAGLEIKATHGLGLGGVIAADGTSIRELLGQLPGLRISANVMPANGRPEPTMQGVSSVVVAPDGSFQITGLKPGRVTLTLYAPNIPKRPLILRIEQAGVALSQGFDLEPGQSMADLQIVVAVGTGSIRGTVNFAGEALPSDWRTYVNCTRENSRGSAGGAQLDARGHFLIRGLPPGTYECVLQMFPFRPQPGYRPQAPQKKFVTVANDLESEITFSVESGSKEAGP